MANDWQQPYTQHQTRLARASERVASAQWGQNPAHIQSTPRPLSAQNMSLNITLNLRDIDWPLQAAQPGQTMLETQEPVDGK